MGFAAEGIASTSGTVAGQGFPASSAKTTTTFTMGTGTGSRCGAWTA